jgi:hypothetical protein
MVVQSLLRVVDRGWSRRDLPGNWPWRSVGGRGIHAGSREDLTPFIHDPPTAAALAVVAARPCQRPHPRHPWGNERYRSTPEPLSRLRHHRAPGGRLSAETLAQPLARGAPALSRSSLRQVMVQHQDARGSLPHHPKPIDDLACRLLLLDLLGDEREQERLGGVVTLLHGEIGQGVDGP